MRTGGNFSVSEGADRLADRLRAFGARGDVAFQNAVVSTTRLTHEAIVDKITNDIIPHSGKWRVVPESIVTDLVDTGAYRQSWTPSLPRPFSGQVATNSEYAEVLEYGFNGTVNIPEHTRRSKNGGTHTVRAHTAERHTQGFFVARDTARLMQPIFKEKLLEAIRSLSS